MSAQIFSTAVIPPAPQPRADRFPPLADHSWSVAQRGSIVEVGYGAGNHFPQYAALHSECGFLRVTPSPLTAWGTSIILLPSLWIRGKYHQGAPIDLQWRQNLSDLVISFSGTVAALRVFGQINLKPPRADLFFGEVAISVSGDADVDYRPGEAFKPVALSSMHISQVECDAGAAQISDEIFDMPAQGWVIPRPVVTSKFALNGRSSGSKRATPSIEIEMNEPRQITGWKTATLDPDDDNVGLWAASDRVLRSWQYRFTSRICR